MGFGIWSLVASAFLAGCAVPNAPKATDIPPAQATAFYWNSQPAVAAAADPDFFKLWDACLTEVRLREFLIDRQDYRAGVLTTQPLTSHQFWEVWRDDIGTFSGVADASLATIRRTVRFELKRDGEHFVAAPKVLIERYASAERRLTSITQYHSAFTAPRPTGESDVNPTTGLPTDYWYAVGRDEPLERDIADAVRHRLASGHVLALRF